MDAAELIVVTGPPGAGKSSVAASLADRYERSALVAGDEFFRFLRAGYVEPWLPESNAQNVAVGAAAGAACGRLVEGGIDVVYDGVLGPWAVDEFRAATGLARLRYVILLPDLATCVERVRTRTGHGFTDLDAARHMHGEFVRATADARNVLADPSGGPADVAATVADHLAAGRFGYP